MNNYVRRRETSIWEQDWYCELGGEYQHFWDFINDNCDNAGIWIPNKKGFEMRTGFRVNLDSFFKKVNGDKKRIIVTDNGGWFLPGFIQEQWFSKQNSFDLVLNNNFHLSLLKTLKSFNINELSVRGLRGVSQGADKGSERGLYIINKNNSINTIEEDINHKELKKEKKEEEKIFFENTKFLIPKMQQVWKNENPDYPDDKKKDFHALQNLAKFIFKQQGIKYDASDDSLCAQILKIWQELVLDIAKHDFFKNYSLLQVDKHIQNIIQNLKNGKSANTIKNTKGISSVGRTIEFDKL